VRAGTEFEEERKKESASAVDDHLSRELEKMRGEWIGGEKIIHEKVIRIHESQGERWAHKS